MLNMCTYTKCVIIISSWAVLAKVAMPGGNFYQTRLASGCMFIVLYKYTQTHFHREWEKTKTKYTFRMQCFSSLLFLGGWQIMNCRCFKTNVVEGVPHPSVKYKLLFMCLQKKKYTHGQKVNIFSSRLT